MPKVGVAYQRKHGNKGIVTVVSIGEVHVMVKDGDGTHFVDRKRFNIFFKEVV